MSAARRSEDQFLCSICLDVFTGPVTTPCGHNFCKACITKYWDTQNQYLCPVCKQVFPTRPDLKVNTLISEMVAQFRHEDNQRTSSSSSQHQESKPGEVLCDVCTGTKLKALKSCLVCLVSYCRTHLVPHQTVPGLKRHQLVDPAENLEDRMCRKHDKPLELFCKTDQTCVCTLCPVLDHKTHEFVPLREEYEEQKVQLDKTEAEVQQMIQERRLKIEEIKRSVKLSQKDADREIAEGVQVFISLKESVERSIEEFIQTIEEKQKTTEEQSEGFIKELEQEISELKKRSTEVEQLSRSEDHLHLLQRVQSLNIHHPPPTKDWTGVNVCPPSHEGTVVRAVTQLEKTLSEQMKKKLQEVELKKVPERTDYPHLTAPQAQQTLFTAPQVQQSLFTAPQAQQPVVTIPQAQQTPLLKATQAQRTPPLRAPRVRQTLFTVPRVRQSVLTAPQAQQTLFTAPQAQQTLFTVPQAQQPVVTVPRVRQSVLTPPQAQQTLFTAPQAQQTLFTAPQAQQPVVTAPRVWQTFPTALQGLPRRSDIFRGSADRFSQQN